jgi:phosphatidylglycerol:prolipoprotein diacylglycerol transferase
VLFYNLPYYIEYPAKIIAIWEGGMSFHGGVLASAMVALYLAKKYKLELLELLDLIAVPTALTTALPRVANFINRELYGRVIESESWKWLGVDFGDGLLRFPSQLFQSAGAVFLFFILLFIYSRKPKKGMVAMSYLVFYGLIRFTLEFWRQPDAQIGFLFEYFSLGQLLSLTMALVGIGGLMWLRKSESP